MLKANRALDKLTTLAVVSCLFLLFGLFFYTHIQSYLRPSHVKLVTNFPPFVEEWARNEEFDGFYRLKSLVSYTTVLVTMLFFPRQSHCSLDPYHWLRRSNVEAQTEAAASLGSSEAKAILESWQQANFGRHFSTLPTFLTVLREKLENKQSLLIQSPAKLDWAPSVTPGLADWH